MRIWNKICPLTNHVNVCCGVSYLCYFVAEEEEGRPADEADRGADRRRVRLPECPSVGLRHDGGGALLAVRPQPVQPARRPSGRKVRTCEKDRAEYLRCLICTVCVPFLFLLLFTA